MNVINLPAVLITLTVKTLLAHFRVLAKLAFPGMQRFAQVYCVD